MRTILWFLYFWLYLIFSLPAMFRANRLLRQGRIQERDAYIKGKVRKWAASLLRLAGVKVQMEGLEKIPQGPAVFIANHQGNFDIPILLANLDEPKALMSKIEVQKLPLIRTWMKHLDCIFLDRSSARSGMASIAQSVDLLNRGKSLIIFPEGTRSKGGPVAEFKSGSLRIAVKAKVPVVPVVIDGSYKVMEQNRWGILIRPALVKVSVLDAIETAGLTKEEGKDLYNRVRDLIVAQLESGTAGESPNAGVKSEEHK